MVFEAAGHRIEEGATKNIFLLEVASLHHPGILPPQPLAASILDFDLGVRRGMMADGGPFPKSVEVVVDRVVLAEVAECASAVLLFLPGGPSLVAALAARRRLGGNGLLVQRRPTGLTNLPKFNLF